MTMSKGLATKSSTAMLDPTALRQQLAEGLDTALNATAQDVEGFGTILKMTKQGTWIYGADEVDVEEGSKWAVHPGSIMVGFVSWPDTSGDQPLEVQRGLREPPVTQAELPPALGVKQPWKRQIAIDLMCVSGQDEGLMVRFATSSRGGLVALRALIDEIRGAVAEGDAFVPVVTLETDWYKHKEYGRIYNPVLKVVKFTTLDTFPDADAEEEEEAPEPAQKKPAAKKRAPVTLEPDEDDDLGDEEEEDDEPAPPTRRRRRAAK